MAIQLLFIRSTSARLHPIPIHSWITIGRHPQDQSSLGAESDPLRGERRKYVKLEGLSYVGAKRISGRNEHYSIHYLSIALKALI